MNIKFAIVAGMVVGALGMSVIKLSFAGNTGQKKCDYTKIISANIGVGINGEIKYNSEWQKVIDDGWQLKTIVFMANPTAIFEKCN